MSHTDLDNGEIKSVVVVKRDAHPELYEDLMKVRDPRARSERLRTLGTSYLLALSNGLSVEAAESKEIAVEGDKSQDSLIARLGGSIQSEFGTSEAIDSTT